MGSQTNFTRSDLGITGEHCSDSAGWSFGGTICLGLDRQTVGQSYLRESLKKRVLISALTIDAAITATTAMF